MLVVYLLGTPDFPRVVTDVGDNLIPAGRWREFWVGPKGSWGGQWNKEFDQPMTCQGVKLEVFRTIESIVDRKMDYGLSIENVVINTQSGMVDFLPYQANLLNDPFSVHTSTCLSRLAQKLEGLYIYGTGVVLFWPDKFRLPDNFREHQPYLFRCPQQGLLELAKPKGWDPKTKRMTQADPQGHLLEGPQQLPSITQLLGPLPDLQPFAWRQEMGAPNGTGPEWNCTVRLQSFSSRDPSYWAQEQSKLRQETSHWVQEQLKLRQETLTMEKVGLCQQCKLLYTCTPAHHGLAWNSIVGTFEVGWPRLW